MSQFESLGYPVDTSYCLFMTAIWVGSELSHCGFVLHQMTKDTGHLFMCGGWIPIHEVLRTKPLGITCQLGNYLSVLKKLSKIFMAVTLESVELFTLFLEKCFRVSFQRHV